MCKDLVYLNMETIQTLNTYNTGTFNSHGIGRTMKHISWTLENILKFLVFILYIYIWKYI